MSQSRNRMQPLTAWRALRRLIADPEQTHEVFQVIRALSGPALERAYRRFRTTAVGRDVLEQKLDLIDVLGNRDYLATLPAGSLGRRYLNFMTQENLTASGLVEASVEEEHFENMDADFARFAARQRDMHDLWHTLTQYGRDELGETCLLAFTYAQTKNRGIGVICLAGTFKLRERYGSGVFQAVWRAYTQGRRARWLPAQPWEHLLTQPAEAVRADLGLTPPTVYEDLRQQPTAA
jgi:ubiquinone biosynthesis protein COQ4